ncbi:SDR family oxidoreductase, partial [Bordetella pertussis]|uniref:SDR family oxidoreductase n=1 Tax=Bordetella pertussis TaxID=520 RepID=UPI0012B23745
LALPGAAQALAARAGAIDILVNNAGAVPGGGEGPRHGVRVFGVNPSRTRTDRVLGLAQQRAQARWNDPDRWQETLSGLPFDRLMEPAEVADVVVFGCSPRAGYLSATVIDLDGGEQYRGAA